jgi:hypothetical protein
MIAVRLLLRFILVPLGASVAWLVAAAVVLTSQWGKLMMAVNDQTASENFWVLLLVIGPIYVLVWFLIAVYSMLPALIGILIAEGFAIRHWIFHALNGALSVWIGATLVDQSHRGSEYLSMPIVLLGAGIAAGFAYWAIAGWSAGFWKPVFAPPVPPQTTALPRPPVAQA